jgi:hypothetical protein
LVKLILLHQVGGTWNFAMRVDTKILDLLSIYFVNFFPHLNSEGEFMKA